MEPGSEKCYLKKEAYKAWFQNKADLSLHSRYAEARMSATLTVVKKFKMQSWEIFRHKLESLLANYTAPSRQKISHCRSIKDQNGFLLSSEKNILGRWRKYFENLLNSISSTTPHIHEVHLGKVNTITAVEAPY